MGEPDFFDKDKHNENRLPTSLILAVILMVMTIAKVILKMKRIKR